MQAHYDASSAAKLAQEQNRRDQMASLSSRLAAAQQQNKQNAKIAETLMNNRSVPQLAQANRQLEATKQARVELSSHIQDMNARQLEYEAVWGKPADSTFGQVGQILLSMTGATTKVFKNSVVDALYYGTPVGSADTLLSGGSNTELKSAIDSKIESLAPGSFTGGWGDEEMVGAAEIATMFTPGGLAARPISAVKKAAKEVSDRNSALFRSRADPLLDTVGDARVSHPQEYKTIMDDLAANNVRVEIAADVPQLTFDPVDMKITLPEFFSISALRHEYGHVVDHKQLGAPNSLGFYMANPQLKLASERRQYLAEINFAKEIGDQGSRRQLIQNYLEEKKKVLQLYPLDPVTNKPIYGGPYRGSK